MTPQALRIVLLVLAASGTACSVTPGEEGGASPDGDTASPPATGLPPPTAPSPGTLRDEGTVRITNSFGSATAPGAPTIVSPSPAAYVTVAKPKVAVAASPGATRFEWTIEGGEFTDAAGNASSTVATGPSVLFQAGSPGPITLSCIATNDQGSSERTTVSVIAVVPPLVELSATPELFILGGSTTLRATYEDGTSAQVLGAGPIASGGTLVVSPGADTRYTVEVTNAAGDAVTASVRVIVLPTPLETSFKLLSPRTGFSLASKMTVPEHAAIEHWASRPPMPSTFAYPMQPTLTAAERTSVAELKSGRFRPNDIYPWIDSTVPPRWTDNTSFDQTYAFYTHALSWTIPLVKAWVVDGDEEALSLFKSVISSWIQASSSSPFPAAQAWVDHPASYRSRLLSWFWALWQSHAATDPAFASLVLRSVYQHGTYLSALTNYAARSNHAVHMDGSLLAAAATFPEFQEAGRWMTVANQRLSGYALRTFSDVGFNLEQSPYYHWYALDELGANTVFMRENALTPPTELQGALERGYAVWPYMFRPDRRLPNVGDSAGSTLSNWEGVAQRYLGGPVPPAAPGMASARPGAGPFIADFDSGYAVFAPDKPSTGGVPDDTYLMARINSKPFTGHCHADTGSFELYGLGREWLVDSGKLSYDNSDPVRQYMRSARAHNVVLVDDESFGFLPVRLLSAKRTLNGDSVSIRHELPTAYHTRTTTLTAARALRLADRLVSRDGLPHRYTQLLHVAPGLTVSILSPRDVRLTSPDGGSATIRQNGPEGVWTATTGQMTPYVLGWYSNAHGVKTPITTLGYSTSTPATSWELDTEITLHAQP